MIVGLTGTSGSGKTSVAQIFEQLGFYIIDADKIAREVTQIAKTEIKENFPECFSGDELVREKLRQTVFENPEKRLLLEKITHKYIIKKMRNEAKGKNFSLYDAPLLFEAGLEKDCDFTVCVVAPEELRLERIRNRDNLSKEEIKKRFKAQKTDKEFMELCDFTIDSTGGLDSLQGQVEEILRRMKIEEKERNF